MNGLEDIISYKDLMLSYLMMMMLRLTNPYSTVEYDDLIFRLTPISAMFDVKL